MCRRMKSSSRPCRDALLRITDTPASYISVCYGFAGMSHLGFKAASDCFKCVEGWRRSMNSLLFRMLLEYVQFLCGQLPPVVLRLWVDRKGIPGEVDSTELNTIASLQSLSFQLKGAYNR